MTRAVAALDEDTAAMLQTLSGDFEAKVAECVTASGGDRELARSGKEMAEHFARFTVAAKAFAQRLQALGDDKADEQAFGPPERKAP